MIMRKETLVFLASLAIIFIIGYINMSLTPDNAFDDLETGQMEPADLEGDIAEIIEGGVNEVDFAEILPEETDYEILGDITDLSSVEEASSEGVLGVLNVNFANFKLNKEKGNIDVLDYLEGSLSSALISDNTKDQFEQLLLKKNSFIEAEQGIELMLQSKGYNESIAIVDESMVKVVTNDTVEQADATIILDVVVSETNYTPSQIKIVKFDNIDL
ncbi:MAG: SpoIIIAH-like family protein [Tissierellia bacterium]|nr:SpoIIIAH-like family protein [Tissierellia bacterium]MDD3226843.1 SpoIIIAH-like family protein [Tissierellia bacterium]MDD4045602.1 SpoIIIAH-like family protein [Tissierellia bacterium]MDD4678612.1 SpoIIIAH-like family protein [Tissierellia bacterium]